jgi:hypothetical protein
MEITVQKEQEGALGDFVESSLGAKGRRHFVTPKFQTMTRRDADMFVQAVEATGRKVSGRVMPAPDAALFFSPDVILSASEPSEFAAKFEWVNARPVAGKPHLARVSRRFAGQFRVAIKSKQGGPVAKLDVWVVESVISATAVPDRIGRIGAGSNFPRGAMQVSIGYLFRHAIRPKTIVTATDRPKLEGRNSVLLPHGTNWDGENLQLGVDRKWDCSRAIRQKIVNPSGIPLTSDTKGFAHEFPHYPSVVDGDGHPKGVGMVPFRDAQIAGNDDAFMHGGGGVDVNPYDDKARQPHREDGVPVGPGTAPKGELRSYDRPMITVPNTIGSNGDRLEWRVHFLEFTRLQINRKWYVISERFPWRVHLRFRKENFRWVDDNSEKALDNAKF